MEGDVLRGAVTDCLGSDRRSNKQSSTASMSPNSDSAAAETPCTSNGTGVFIPACILDGSALANPAIMSKPHRKRRGSAVQLQSEPKHGSTGGKQLQKQQQQPEVGAGPGDAAAGSSSSSGNSAAKNPFAATPKNIRQQQLLCNLVAAADCFSEAAGPAAVALPPVGSSGNLSVAASSRSPSLDLAAVPAAALVQQQQQQALLAAAAAAAAGGMALAPSFELTRSSSRASMDSCYYHPRSSCELASSTRTSGEQSCRSSLDRCSSSYSRPSTESTFSCYGRPSAEYAAGTAAARQSFCQQQQQQMTGVAVGRRTALDLGHRPSLDFGSRPVAAAELQQRAASMEIARRMSMEVAASSVQRHSFDNSDCNDVLQHWQQQQAAAHAAPRRDGSNVSSGSTISSGSSLPSPGLPADAAAALTAQQAMLVQLQQQLLLGRLPNSNAMSAAAAAMASQGLMPDRAAAQAQLQAGLMLRAGSGGSPPAAFASPKAAGAAAGLPPVGPHRPGSGGNASSGSGSGHAHDMNLIQQQLQQAMQTNQIAAQMAAAAAAGKAASQQQAMQAMQMLQLQRDSAAWQQLLGQFSQEAADLSGLQAQEQLALARLATSGQQQCSSLDAEVSAASLQQQLELLQMLQL
ncbi:hypothetical protein COO60DRAFT_397713 [Scenedesmus sp. NREL 46B-D3]|nr:hypothetical protein COO60DRAFT_397713 [Scenedesmus sp. NREL 46B-D3]